MWPSTGQDVQGLLEALSEAQARAEEGIEQTGKRQIRARSRRHLERWRATLDEGSFTNAAETSAKSGQTVAIPSYVQNTRTLHGVSDVQSSWAMAATQDGSLAGHIGPRIRARRRHAGLSQEELAKRLVMRRHHLSDWERGKIAPKEPNLKRLARALNCEWTDFFNDELDADGELI